MSPDDVPDAEMLKRLRLRFRFGKHADALSPQHLQSGEWYDVADLLGAAAAPANATELAGERDIVAAFQREHLGSESAPARRRPPVRSRMLNSLLTGKIAAALAAAAVGATGAATAAYADALPDSVQDIAHHLIAAPPAHSHASDTGREHGHVFSSPLVSPSPSLSPSPTVSPSSSVSASALTSPSPSSSTSTDPAAFGLCTAWANAVAHNLENQVGFRDKLSKIAGGDASMTDDAITSFCATVHKSDDGGPGSDDPAEHDANDDHGHDGDADHNSTDSASASPSATAGSTADDHGHDGDNHGNSGGNNGGSGNGNGGHGNDDGPGHH